MISAVRAYFFNQLLSTRLLLKNWSYYLLGDILRIESSKDSIRAVVYPTPAAPPDVISIPFGQGRQYGSDYATSGNGNESSNVMDILETTQVKDTGSLAWAGTRVRVSKTGESISISKLEGDARAVEIGLTPAEDIIKTIVPDQH